MRFLVILLASLALAGCARKNVRSSHKDCCRLQSRKNMSANNRQLKTHIKWAWPEILLDRRSDQSMYGNEIWLDRTGPKGLTVSSRKHFLSPITILPWSCYLPATRTGQITPSAPFGQ